MARTSDADMRLAALDSALRISDSPANTIARAQTYLDFLLGTAAPSAVVSPSAPDAEPARLDDPAMQAETAETLVAVGSSPEPTPEPDPSTLVVERPTVQGDASTPPAGTSSSVPAASSSPSAPPTEAAPAAATSSPTIGIDKVQAAVIAASKGIGRDATVAVLQAHGGARLPDVPADKHAALFAALNDKLAAAGKDTVSA